MPVSAPEKDCKNCVTYTVEDMDPVQLP